MKIVDDAMLQRFREAPHCEFCGEANYGKLDPHHCFCRGFGGGSRLDVRTNLVSLCRRCHDEVHAGRILRSTLLMIVAIRERMTVDQVESVIYELRRTPKHKAAELSALARRVLPAGWEG